MNTTTLMKEAATRIAARLSSQIVAAVFILAAALAVAGCGAEAEQLDTPSRTPSATYFPAKTPPTDEGAPATSTPGAVEPTPAPAPAPVDTPASAPAVTGSLKHGDWVQVTGEGCLNARTRPGLNPTYPEENPDDSILNCLPAGFIGRLEPEGPYTAEQPIVLDGYNWWYMVAQGWVAEDWLAFHHEGGAFWPPREDLAGAGLIAYIGTDNGLWVMNADGSGQRLLVAGAAEGSWIGDLAWSPTGHQLSYSMTTYGIAPSVVTRIIGLDGALAAEFSGLTYASWSPDGGRLAGIRQAPADQFGNITGTPVVRDLVSGAEVPVGPASWYSRTPAWSPDGATLAFSCSSYSVTYTNPDGTTTDIRTDCGGDGVRIVNADGTNARMVATSTTENGPYFAGISWSPAGDTIAVNSFPSGEGCRGIAILDAQSGASRSCLAFPEANVFGCGWGGSEQSEWTPDATRIMYHVTDAAIGTGIVIVNLASGGETLIPVSYASGIDVTLNGQQIVFQTGSEIWVANTDGTGAAPIAEGRMPAWRPL